MYDEYFNDFSLFAELLQILWTKLQKVFLTSSILSDELRFKQRRLIK